MLRARKVVTTVTLGNTFVSFHNTKFTEWNLSDEPIRYPYRLTYNTQRREVQSLKRQREEMKDFVRQLGRPE